MRWRLFFRDLGIVLGAVVVGGAIMYSIMHYQQLHTKQNSVLAAQTEVDSLLGKVGKVMELPKEIPTVATVSDSKKLQGQPFFINAKNGDKVLIFVQGKEAVLYRPSENKIITVAPVNMQDTPTPQLTPIPSPSVTLPTVFIKSKLTPVVTENP